jgi:hypothetical protein
LSAFFFKISELQPGKRTWNFKTDLPFELPSSTTEKYGSIAYKVVVTFERPWKFNLEHIEEFTVIKPLALSPALKNPTEQDIRRTFMTGVLETKPIKATIFLPATGFIPGETINIKVDLVNPTYYDVKHLRVSLIKVTDHKSQTPYQQTEQTRTKLEKVTAGQPFCNGTRKYEINFHIPENVVPTITDKNCPILNVSYLIRVKVKLLKCLKSPAVEFPITIGTIGFMEPPENGTTSTPKRMETATAPSVPYPTAPDFPCAPQFPVTPPYPMGNSPGYHPANKSAGGPIGFVVS